MQCATRRVLESSAIETMATGIDVPVIVIDENREIVEISRLVVTEFYLYN